MTAHASALLPDALDTNSSVSDYEKVALLDSILEHFPGGIAVYDKDLRLTVCNDKLKRMLDYPEELFEFGMPTMEQVFRFNALRGEYGKGNVEHLVAAKMELARKREPHVYERSRLNGMVLEVRGVPLRTGGFLTIYIDVSMQRAKSAVNNSDTHSETDKLTGLPSLKSLEHELSHFLRHRQRGDVSCLHCLDLDSFSEFNKTKGAIAGDFILKEVASRLTKVTRGTDFVARTGGDRFQILQPRVTRPSDVTRLATRLIEAIKMPIRLGDEDIRMSATVGFATINDATELSVESIVARANESLMVVKRKHRLEAKPAVSAA